MKERAEGIIIGIIAILGCMLYLAWEKENSAFQEVNFSEYVPTTRAMVYSETKEERERRIYLSKITSLEYVRLRDACSQISH